MNIDQLVKESFDIADSHGWHDEERSFGDLLALLHSEISEALEEYRNGHPINGEYLAAGKPEGVPIELADILIRVGDICGIYGIDLEHALLVKMSYNKDRSYKHGNKVM